MLKTMDKMNRLQCVYDYARSKSVCRTKQEFAAFLGVQYTNLTRAMNGDTRYLTDKLLIKINECFDNIFSLEWLMYGTGEMMANSNNISTPAPTPTPTPTHTRITQQVPTQITSYDDDVEYLKKRVAELEAWNWSNTKLIKLLEKEIEELKKGTVSARAN